MKSTEPSPSFPAPENNQQQPQKKTGKAPVILQIFFCFAILGAGAALAYYYSQTGPEAKPRKREARPPLVQVTDLQYGSHQLTLSSMGTVLAEKEINLTSGVGGEIISISDHLVPGGFFKKGDHLVTIDPLDYELAILQLKSEVAKAKSDLELEMGNQLIARKEYEILSQEVTAAEKNLMLRNPQLGIKKATLKGIEARLAQAELNLKRCRIVAPFNGVVLSRSVNHGTRVTQSTVLARLVETDRFWLKLAIPTGQLQWIHFPDKKEEGSRVKIFLSENGGKNNIRFGRVLRLAADVEKQGRMAAVYVEVEDPLSLLAENSNKPKLLLESFVRAEIEGVDLQSVISISRDHLRENNSVWILAKDNTLDIRQVEILTKTDTQVLISSGLSDGEKLITSGLSAPVPGTSVKLLQPGKNLPETGNKAKKQMKKAGKAQTAKSTTAKADEVKQ